MSASLDLRWALASCVSLTLAAACGDATEARPIVAPTTYSEFLDGVPAAYCEGLYACPGAGEDGGSSPERFFYRSASECQKRERRANESRLRPALAQALDEGRVVFRPDDAAACLESLRGLGPRGCLGLFEWNPRCASVIDGTRGPGEPARIGEECEHGTLLAQGASGCPTCVAYPESLGHWLGDPCDAAAPNGGCVHPMQCVVDVSGGTAGHCQEPDPNPVAARGEPCGYLTPGARTVCERGLACLFGTDAPAVGHCGDPIAVGESCQTVFGPTNPCTIGAGCIPSSDDAATCVRARIRDRGETCDPDPWSSGVFCSLVDNLYCDESTSRCAPSGDGSEGASCWGNSDCHHGLLCLAQVCSTGADGSSCTNDFQCRSGYCIGFQLYDRSPPGLGTCAPYGSWNECP